MAEHPEKQYRGEYPDVQDEAGASPRWLPALGFAILCVMGLFVAYRAASAHQEAAGATDEVSAAQTGETADTADEGVVHVPAEPEGAEDKPE